jgi:archaellum component FlaC
VPARRLTTFEKTGTIIVVPRVLRDGMTLGDVDGNAVRAENVLCSRRIEQRDVGVRVVYEIRAAADGRVLVTDRLHGVDPDGFAFDPENEPDQWAMQDETVAFKVPVSAGETATYVYGVKTEEPEDLLIRDPTLERVDEESSAGGAGSSAGGAENRGVLAGFGSELRSAVRRVSGDDADGDAGAVATAALDEEAVAELDATIESFEQRLDSLEVERARQALDPMEERLAALSDRVETIDEQFTAVEDRLDAIEDQLAALETGDSADADTVERLQQEVGELDRRTEDLETARSVTTDRLQRLESRAEERGAAMERVTERVESTENDLQQVREAQERLEDRLGSVADGIERFEAMWDAMESAMGDREAQPAD